MRRDRMRVVFAGGGTGGHVYPAVALATALREIDREVEILFLGTERGLEGKVVRERGYELRTLPGRGARRAGLVGWIAAPLLLLGGIARACWHIGRFRPHVVVGTGGYASAAGGLAAALLGRPLMLQEQNAVPGLTNRLLARFAKEIHVAFHGAEAVFRTKAKIAVSGNPIRPEMLAAWRERGEAEETAASSPRGGDSTERSQPLGNDLPGTPLLLVFGGSQGATSINQAAARLAGELTGRGEARFLILAGRRHYEELRSVLEGVPGVRVEGFVEDMATVYSAADLALCRSGALTLAELTLWGVPAVLVPYPFAADDHQAKNAEEMVRAGAAVVLADHALNEPEGLAKITSLIQDRERLRKMAERSRKLGKPEAARTIAEAIRRLAGWTARSNRSISVAAAL